VGGQAGLQVPGAGRNQAGGQAEGREESGRRAGRQAEGTEESGRQTGGQGRAGQSEGRKEGIKGIQCVCSWKQGAEKMHCVQLSLPALAQHSLAGTCSQASSVSKPMKA
jgi:hypothetical protein